MTYKFSKSLFLITSILISGFYLIPTPSMGAIMCGAVNTPSIEITINGTTYTGNTTVTVNQGDVVSFNVRTVSVPGSGGEITYPGGGTKTYSAPSSINYTTAPINGGESIAVWVQQNCLQDLSTNDIVGDATILFDVFPTPPPPPPPPPQSNPICFISSFTADDTTPPNNTSTTLRFSFQDSVSGQTDIPFSWSINLIQGGILPSPSGGTLSDGYSTTNNLSTTHVYKLVCGNESRVLTVTPDNLPPPQICTDPSANNYGGSLPCTYSLAICQDSKANNYGGPLPCTYNSPTCQDPNANNYGGPLPCKYNLPTCQDPNATNFGGSLPCQYASCPEDALITVIDPLPSMMESGKTYSYTMRVQNTGSTKWYHGTVYKFVKKSGNIDIAYSADPSKNYGHLPFIFLPGDYHDFTFNVVAPSVPGKYSVDMQMLHYAGAEYMRPNGRTCRPPTSDTYFGNIGTVSSKVIPVFTIPPPVAGFYVGPSHCGNYWLNLSWGSDTPTVMSDAPVYETTYKVYRNESILVYNGNGQYFSDLGLIPGATYTYSITRTDSRGTSLPVSASATVASRCIIQPRVYFLDIQNIGTGSGVTTGSRFYSEGQNATTTAVANPGSEFGGWGGDCSGMGTNSPIQIKMDNEKACTARFNKIVTGSVVCGDRNTTYTADVSSYPIGSSYCIPQEQFSGSDPGFPGRGLSVYWTCDALVAGENNISCMASRDRDVTNNNNPPNLPTISGLTVGNRNINYTYTFIATDPDNDRVRYGVDWDNDGVVDEWLPSNTTYVDSGIAVNTNHSWSNVGSKTFQALTKDVLGLTSGWRSHVVNISNNPPPPTESCATSGATNIGAPLPCQFPGGPGSGNCQDVNATNNGQPRPCQYRGGGSSCTDTGAVPPSGPLPCRFGSGGPINGACGNRNTSYPYGITQYPAGSAYCSPGTAVEFSPNPPPNFPPSGGSVTWNCAGISGGAKNGLCEAKSLLEEFIVDVTARISSGGKVTSTDHKIDCGIKCRSPYQKGSSVTLTATPKSSYWKFSGWEGDCSGTLPICVLNNITREKNVTAVFELRSFNYIEF